MHRNNEENVVFILQKAIMYFKINVGNTTVKKFLLSRSHYSSFKRVCDALNIWKVENSLDLELDKVKAHELTFIAHLKLLWRQVTFVKKMENNQVFHFVSEGKKINETFEKFEKKLSSAVILLDTEKESGEKNYSWLWQETNPNKSLLPLGTNTFLLFILFDLISEKGTLFSNLNFRILRLGFITIIGFTAPLFLVLLELKISVFVADKICGFSSKTDCGTVLSSNASRLFEWVNWVDAGFIYFTAMLFIWLG